MSYIDYNLILSDAQSLAAITATSTYSVDMQAAGFGHNDELYVQFLVNTAFTITAGASITMALWVSNETTLSSLSLAATKIVKWDSTNASAGAVLATMHIGPDILKYDSGGGSYRYLYAIYTLSSTVSVGKIDAYLLKDIDMTMDKVL
jgi:hypothetical protein